MKVRDYGMLPALFRSGALIISMGACACAHTTAAPVNPVSDNTHHWDVDVFDLSSRADSAYEQNQWLDAARHYEKLTLKVPQDPYIWFRLGNTYARQGDYRQAITAYETSLSRNSRQPKPWFNLSTAYLLSAQAAMLRAMENLRSNDSARVMIERRLVVLDELMHQRIEDAPSHTSNTYSR